jgi:hypothetical protein
MKIFSKEIRFDSELFEIAVTFCFMVLAGFLGWLNFPRQAPISLPQFILLCSILGFVVGYGVSSYIVANYKAFKKSRVK